MTISVDRAGLWDAEALADVAAATFPLACPPHATNEDIAAFIDNVLSAEKFSEYLTDPTRTVLKATSNGEIVGYVMLVDGAPEDEDVRSAVSLQPTTEISKLYVLPERHGSGVSAALMNAVVDYARNANCAGVWLGVHQENERAQRFYVKNGFKKVGTRTFRVGAQTLHDFVMQRSI
ncbi:GNAT family N-acetyltransferase [Rhodococcus xishaensis]|uniref:GNAT family N-acetyltransferase n=1 Tax=Rhodococcus xishaensis TaxID=2487364 RepID=A0A438AZB4_9NOCA|nr:GNAT family N-acetyltransferase [Rhodococcus xishaensis]RVW04002.1 GNAT family N-acetyltransferase [Rhodococcus xishaensis]